MRRDTWAAMTRDEKEDLADHLESLLANASELHPDEERFCQELLRLKKRVGSLRGH